MIYLGSKNRIAKHILPIILKDRLPHQWYVEICVGGGNLIDKVENPRIGADINPYVIEALKLIRDDAESLPNAITENEYADLKQFKNVDGLTGVVGFACSFGSKFFAGYARGSSKNYMANAKSNALSQSPKLKGCIFICETYERLDIPENSIVYCDPPYENTTGYRDSINHSNFWEWCRNMTRKGHQVYISEYNAPEDFTELWSSELRTSFSLQTEKTNTEKLFTYYDI